jgi:Flp pilus assembly protein TadD
MPTPQSLQHWQAAERQLQQGQHELAARAYRTLSREPELAPLAHLRLSLIAEGRGHHRDAVDEAVAAHANRVEDPDLLEMVAKRLFRLGELEPAVAIATSPTMLRSDNAGSLAALGKMLSFHMFPDHALRLFDRARALGLDSPGLRYFVGLNRHYAGDDAGAQEALESCLQQDAHSATALWTLARIGLAPGDGVDRVDRIRSALSRLPEGHADRAMLQYALFTELDRRDEIPAAWDALEAGMRARHATLQFDSAGEQALFDHLGSLGPVDGPGFEGEGARPVFIIGLPRSGTTLLERVLGNHPDIGDAGELTDLLRQLRYCADLDGDRIVDLALARKAETDVDWAELGRRYLSHTQWRARGRDVYTDKLPPNFMQVAYIARALPQARILHMVRGPLDTCFSNIKTLFAGAYPPSHDQVQMAEHYRRYRTLMARWHAAFPGRILDVRYDELVREPERVSAEVLDFIGLRPAEGMSRIESRAGTVATPSSTQVREAIHDRYIGQWRRYEAHLGPLRERLGALAY